MAQRQCGRREDRGRRARIALASQDVEDDVGGVDAVDDRLGAGGIDRGQSIGEHRREDVDHLPIAVVDGRELAPHTLHRGRQHPILEGGTVAQGTRLAGEHWHVVPGVVDRLAAAERTGMLSDDPPVLADHDVVGIGVNLDRPSDRARRHRVLVVVEANQAGLRDRRRYRMEAVEPTRIGNELRPLRLEHLPDRLVDQLRMAMRLGVGDAFVEQPGVQLVKVLEPQPGREEALAHEPDLVLDLPLLPSRCRRAGDRLDEVVTAHLQEAAIVEALLADEDRLHRRLHVVVDAAPAGALEQGECPVVGMAGVRIVAGGPGSRWRARMLRTTSAEWTPWTIASAQAASTAGSPSVSTAVRMSTICRLPSSTAASLRRTRSIAAGSTQSLKGAPLRKAPGLRASTGT